MSQSPESTESLVTGSLLVVTIVFPILATVAVILRFYARRIKSQPFRADDWTIVLSLVRSGLHFSRHGQEKTESKQIMCWASAIIIYVAGAIGGIDTTSMNPMAAARLFFKCLWILGLPLNISLASIKISVLLFYRRIFITPTFKRCADTMIVVLIGWAISTAIAQIFAGDPISSVWNPLAPHLRYNYNAFLLAVAGMSIIFDVMVLCFPLPMIKGMHLPTRRKFIVTGIFWLGAFNKISGHTAGSGSLILNHSSNNGNPHKAWQKLGGNAENNHVEITVQRKRADCEGGEDSDLELGMEMVRGPR
ncbi:MAG: hypothetical protein Q9163_003077 [Psora crenata]